METKIPFHKLLFAGVFLLLAIVILNSFFVFSFGKSLNAKLVEAKELARAAKIEIIKLESLCTDCFNADEVIAALKDSGLEITGEKSLSRNSKEALDLINKYKIAKLPNIILKGEINKKPIENFKQVEDALVYDAVSAPYEDYATKSIVGKVSAIIIKDDSCKACTDFGIAIQNLKQAGVFVEKEKTLDFSEAEAKQLIGKFAIKKLPALLLSNDLDAYPDIAQNIGQSKSKDGAYYVLESQAPYIESESGKLRGSAVLILLNDSSCPTCYDVKIHKSALDRFGIMIKEEKNINAGSAEGKQLISKYNIKSVPTIILSGDISVYEGLTSVWPQVGTVENDGTYVFREMGAMGKVKYKDTVTNEVKEPEPPSSPNAPQ